MSIAESIGIGPVITNEPPNRPASIGAPLTIAAYTDGMKMTGLVIRENGRINQAKSWVAARGRR